jgi:hypothetical protein
MEYYEYLHVKDFALKNKKALKLTAWAARRKAKDYFIKECKTPAKDLFEAIEKHRDILKKIRAFKLDLKKFHPPIIVGSY